MMKRTNRLISTFACAVAMLVGTCAPALAEFKGALRSDEPVTVELHAGPDNAGGAAVTVYYLGRELDVEAVFTVPPGANFAQECSKSGSRVKRIIVEVDLPVGGSALVLVKQGATTRYEFPLGGTVDEGTYRYVFDVV